MAEIEVEGKTVEEAITAGLKKLGVSRDKVEIKILDEGTTGLFGLMGSKPAHIRMTAKDPSASAPRADGETNPDLDYPLTEKRAKEVLGEILRLMNISVHEITTVRADSRVIADVRTDESSILIGKNGQTLEAVEHILTLMLSRDKETRSKITIDTEHYRQRHEERLQVMAKKAADEVRRSGQVYRFEPMPSRDRRVIHVYLKEDPDIETFSEGDGPFRKIGIKPKKQ